MVHSSIRFLLAAGASLALAGSLFVAPSQAVTPRVVGGTPQPATAAATVSLKIFDSECSAVLLLANLIATAAHCVAESEDLPSATPADIVIYPPGANTAESQPSAARVTRILFEPRFVRTQQIGDDIAYLVTDQPVGTPIVTRPATQREAAALTVMRARLQFAGYGQTTPARRGAEYVGSPTPIGMSAPAITWSYIRGIGSIRVAMDGVTGPCYGDSGGPWTYNFGDQLLLIGVESSGHGRPCDTNWRKPFEEVPVLAGSARLLQSAYAAAGAAQPAVPRTCIKVEGDRQECAPGAAWIYNYCWSGSRVILQKLVNGSWQDQYTRNAPRSRDCDADTPFEVSLAGFKSPGIERYRVVVPKQAGIARTRYDRFVVTGT